MAYQKRLRNQFAQIKDALQSKDQTLLHRSIKEVILRKDNIMNWIVLFDGVLRDKQKQNYQLTPLYPGNYAMEIKFNKGYPDIHPSIVILGNFQHFHVYEGGKVCHPMLLKWSYKYSMRQFLNEVCRMLHSPPSIGDEANQNMKSYIDPQEKIQQKKYKRYYEFMKNQSQTKFKNKKYI